MILTLSLATLALLSLVLTLWQFVVTRRFPLHQRTADRTFTPAVTLLKPLRGLDSETTACLETWLTQNYPAEVQHLFGVASADDPVCDVVRKLIAARPQPEAQLVICPDQLGLNGKVSTLIQLEPLARYEVIVISDADVKVTRDFLVQFVAALRDPQVGLVNCFYRLANPANLAMRWEAFVVNADFWGQVLQARSLKPMDFALGAVMATTRAQLSRIGGFAGLVDYLADDYQLGKRIARTGARIELCPAVVECRSAPTGWREVWAHQLRWARTIRVCQPLPYFFSILSNATLWPLLWLAAAPGWASAVGATICLSVRAATACYSERTLAPGSGLVSLWLASVKDLLNVLVWALAFTGNHVTWRGERFHVERRGKLAKD